MCNASISSTRFNEHVSMRVISMSEQRTAGVTPRHRALRAHSAKSCIGPVLNVTFPISPVKRKGIA